MMLLVIIGHTAWAFNNEQIYKLINFIYSFHMPFFFIVSGYFLSTNTSVSDFIKKKAKQLIGAYFKVSAVIYLISFLRDYFWYGVTDISGILSQHAIRLLYASGNDLTSPNIGGVGPIWFFFALFISLAIVRLAINCKNHYVSALIVFSSFVLGLYLSQICMWLPFSIFSGMTCSIYVYIGHLFKENAYLDKCNKSCLLPLAIIWLVQLLNNQLVGCVQNIGMKDIINILGSVAATCIIIMLFKTLPSPKFLTFVGKNSSLILCIHTVEISTIPNHLYLQLFDGRSTWFGLLVSSVVRIVFAVLIAYIITFVYKVLSPKKQKANT